MQNYFRNYLSKLKNLPEKKLTTDVTLLFFSAVNMTYLFIFYVTGLDYEINQRIFVVLTIGQPL